MATKLKPKWDIPTRSRLCCEGQEPLLPEALYYSLLTADENGAYVRRDFCILCWERLLKQGTLSASSTHWKATVPKRQSKKPTNEEFGARALELLKQMTETEDRPSQEEAFVLGLYLHRLRILAPRQEMKREGVDCTLYEVLETSEIITVPRLTLSMQETAQLQERIAKKLNDSDLS